MIAAIYFTGIEDGVAGAAQAWRTAWVDGVPSYEGDPAHTLRERIIRQRRGKEPIEGNRLRAMVLSAWINQKAGRSVRRSIAMDAPRLDGWSRERLGLSRTLAP